MAKGAEKQRRRELANREATRRRAEALEERPVGEKLRGLLADALAEIDADDSEPVADEGHVAELLQLDPGIDLTWVSTSSGYLFRHHEREAVWRFLLSWSALAAVARGDVDRIQMTREE